MDGATFRRLVRDSLHAGKSVQIPSHGLQRAGVLVPIVMTTNGCTFLFTKRTEHVETHKGQISFPGGVIDQADAGIVETALREAYEEIGLPREAVEVLGLLGDLATPTGFVITPVVGWVAALPPLAINTDEVDEVFQVPVQFFAEGGKGRMEPRNVQGRAHEVWYYDTGSHIIWGATAAIIRSLLQMVHLG